MFLQCMPAPGTFLPCNDLFDWWTLRCSVWIVFLLALLGNGCVVIVLVSSRGKMDVPRFAYFHSFLMCLANHELSCQSNSFEFSYFTLIKSQLVGSNPHICIVLDFKDVKYDACNFESYLTDSRYF